MKMNRKNTEHKTLKYKRTHPFTITTYLKTSVVLLALPVIQQILYRPDNIIEIIGSMSFSAVFAFAAIFYAFASYNGMKYCYTGRRIYVRSGVLVKRHFCIDYDKVHVFGVQKRWWAALFGAVKISFDTSAGGRKRADASFWISLKKLDRFFKDLRPNAKKIFVYRAGNIRMALMSASWSNPGTGLLFIAPFVSKIGSILGERFQEMFYESFNVQLQLVALGLPPVVATITNILIFGWAVAMLVQFARYANFSAYCRGNYLVTSRGLIDKSIYITKSADIAALSINQTLTMALFKLYSAAIFTVGFGKDKGDKSLIVVAEQKGRLHRSIQKLVPLSAEEQQTIHPVKRARKSYLLVPSCVAGGVLVCVTLLGFFDIVNSLIWTILLFALIPLVWWILFRLLAYSRAMFAVNGQAVVACGYKGLTTKKYIIPYKKVQYVNIQQNIFQRRAGTCNVKIYLLFESRVCHTVKHLPLRQTMELVELINSRIE